MGVPTINTSTWFGAGTASTAVLTPAQVAAVAPLVRVTAAYVVMYYAFCFFQSWSKLYLFASRRPTLLFFVLRLVLLCLVLGVLRHLVILRQRLAEEGLEAIVVLRLTRIASHV